MGESKEYKITKTVEAFLQNPEASMIELSDITGYSKSSCQRYLNDPMIKELFDERVNDFITSQLAKNKHDAQIQGGINSFNNNKIIQDSNGHFSGSIPEKLNREYIKQRDIMLILNSYLDNLSINKVSEELGYTRDYVYDCLTDKRIVSLLGEEKYIKVQQILNTNLPDNFKKPSKK